MVLGCVASTSAAPGTSAVMMWISLPPNRLYTSAAQTAVPPLVGRNSSVITSNRLILPSSFQHRKDVAHARPARALRQRREHCLHGRAASRRARQRTTQVV